ncbi:MAG TPA: ribbon-helix-helix domain-containing protein [Alphaproteobacteria bacterium]|jgi:predicted DNA-binding ribbon-helix-helix protein|nr:ribbon-helix-helix domain-containing protein [Alphaproteobacteria bacterium]
MPIALPPPHNLTTTLPATADADRRGSTLLNRNIWVGRRRTSLRLEPAMWQALEEVAGDGGLTIHELCTMIDSRRRESTLTAAVRVFLLCYYRDAVRHGGLSSGKTLVDRALKSDLA